MEQLQSHEHVKSNIAQVRQVVVGREATGWIKFLAGCSDVQESLRHKIVPAHTVLILALMILCPELLFCLEQLSHECRR